MEDTRTTQDDAAQPAGLPAVAGSVMDAEAALMKAATEFAYQWGRDQTVHPKMYWLDLHLRNWRGLAEAAVRYTATLESQNVQTHATEGGAI